MPAPLASFRNHQFRWLYFGNLAFFFAMNGQFVVRSYLAYDITGSAFALGIVNFAVAIPMLVVSPFGGVIADRVERRALIMAGQSVLLVNEAAVLALLLADALEFWHLLAVAFLMGCVFPFIMPARQAIVVDIVGRRGLTNAMALQMGGMNAARVIAPALSGFLIYAVDLNWTYAVAIALYAVALASMLRVSRSRAPRSAERKTMLGDIAYGLRYVRDDPPVRVLMLFSIVPILLAMPFQSLLAVFAEDVWDVGALGLGILNAAAGLGGLMGAIYVAFFGETERKLAILMSTITLFGCCLFAFAISPWFIMGVAFVLFADIFAGIFQTINNSIVQVLIPDEIRGRVMSLMMMTFGLTPLGTVPISIVAEFLGAPFAIASASVLLVLAGALFYAISRTLRDIDSYNSAALEADRPGEGRSLDPAAAGA